VRRAPATGRIYLAVFGAALLAGAIYFVLDRVLPERGRTDVRESVLKVIQPYRARGTWVFDDEATGLEGEPFVNGMPEMIDRLVADIPGAASGFRLTISAEDFPDHDLVVERREPYAHGWYYADPRSGQRGWLCPALFKYFREAPERIYVRADPLTGP
jgi:hypothetical protein